MKEYRLHVVYYRKTRYATTRHDEVMTWDEYVDLCLDPEVVVKMKETYKGI